MHMHMFWHAPELTQRSHRSPGSAMSAESSVGYVTNNLPETFIVVSALCFCLSCCLLLVSGFLLLVFGDENLLFAETESIQDNPSQRCARRRESGSKHEGLQCKQ